MWNELRSTYHKKVCKTLNYIEHILSLAPTINGCISISAFASFLGIPMGTTSSVIDLKLCAIAAGIKKYKLTIKKKKKKHDRIVLLATSKLDNTEDLISKAFINSNISHDEFVLINNVLKEHDNTKEETKNYNNK